MEKIIKRFNNLMYSLGREYVTIGTSDTSTNINNKNWNLRDLVSEVQYWLDFWQDDNCIYREEAYDTSYPDHKEKYNQYINDIARMKRFIARYEKEAFTMECTQEHCSKYD